ncbi:MAG TPA: aspartate--tRNA ligase [Vicinamibacteria bacterium]|nr:aspartate--tRNA ligase [Vicinamibacteria bacterium]
MAEPLGDLARTHYCGELREDHVGRTVTLMGWAATRRDLGGVVFLDLRDREGLCQVVARPEVSEEAHARADHVRSEFVVAVVGEVAARSAETVNPNLDTGKVEVLAREIRILSEAKTPVFPIEDEIDTHEEVRLKHRYLDLRRPRMQRNVRLRHQAAMEVRRYLDEQGFYEIETPMLGKSTPEGARDYLVPSRVHHGSFYALPQSPQLFKQILMVSGLDRYYQIARCFRDEDLRADRQPEFTQVDIEMSFPRMETIFDLVEPLFQRVMAVIGVKVERPFPRLPYADALLKYGSDKPDLRFGMPIADVSDELRVLGLANYPGLLEAGARARAIVLPASGGVSGMRLRKINEDLWLARIVPDARGEKRNLLNLKATDDQLAKLAEKGASAEVARKLLDKVGASKDDTVLIGVDQPGPVAMAMGILRLEMGRELRLVDERAYRFLWVTDFPLFEWDRELGRYVSLHHPFTSPVDEDLALLETDPGRVRAKAYDVVLNGYEVGGGSIRIHDSALQAKVFERLALSPEEARDRFGFFLEALQYGTPPHGGIALGLDRMVMIMAGETSLRQVIPFPKTAAGTDLMTGSPSPVREEQTRELGILTVRT